MKKMMIISVIVFIVIVGFFIITSTDLNRTLVCNGDFDLADGNSSQEYVFYGVNEYVKKEKLEVILHTSSKDIIDEYLSIVKNNEECHNIIVEDDYLSYICDYDLVNNHYYSSIEDNSGNLSFKVLKAKFEEDSFVCSYK